MADQQEFNESTESGKEATTISDALEEEQSLAAQDDATTLALKRSQDHRAGRGGNSIEFVVKQLGNLEIEGEKQLEGNNNITPRLKDAVVNQVKAPGDSQTADKGTDKQSAPSKSPKDIEAEKAADDIFKACNGDGNLPSGWGTDEDAIFTALEGKTPEQIAAIKKAYNEKYAKDGKWPTIQREMEDELSGEDLERAKKLLAIEKNVSDNSLSVPGSEYKGEGIKKNIEPSKENVVDPDTIDVVARRKLGPGATQEEVDKYVKETLKLNHLDKPEDANLKLIKFPGHRADGSLVTVDEAGMKKIVSPDGSVKMENPNGTSYEMKPKAGGGYEFQHKGPKPEDNYSYTRTPDGQGGYVEKHTGQRPQDNYVLTRTPEGRYLVADRPGDKPVDKTEFNEKSPDPRVERAKLAEAADAKITDPEKRAKFHTDLEKFEERARKQNLTPEEQAKFYHEVNRLLEAKDDPSKPNLPKEADRIKLAEQVMAHAAEPERIDQGNKGTCGAAALESQMFTKNPADAAKVITDVSLTGEYKCPDRVDDQGNVVKGKPIKPDPSLLKPDSEASKDLTDSKRSYASQIFQGTAISSVYQSYRQEKGDENAKPPDSGERGVDPRGVEQTNGSPLTPLDIQDMNRHLTGRDVPIIEGDQVNKGDGQIHVKDEKELHAKLDELKKAGKLPAVIFVDSRREPFLTDSSGGTAGGSGGGHFVTVTDYDPVKKTATLSGQWGRDSNHKSIPVEELYLATRGEPTKENVAELQRIVDQNRKQNKVDSTLELELLEQKKKFGLISDADFDKQLTDLMVNTRKKELQQERDKSLNEDEKRRNEDQYNRLLATLPEERQIKIETEVNKRAMPPPDRPRR